MASEEYVIEMIDICKHFGQVKANHNVNLKVRKGEIHAIVGENGAGKTTLMNVLFGILSPNSGIIRINGKEVKIKGPKMALDLGIGMVHQHFKLVPEFTVAENICLGQEPLKKTGLVDKKKMLEAVQDISDRFGLNVNPSKRVADLPVGLLQRVEILKSLSRGADILILDEPTAVLTPLECKELFSVLKNMKSQGKTVIIITHKLKEVIENTDNITVLSHGQTKGTVVTSQTNMEELTGLMIDGSGKAPVFERNEIDKMEPVLELSHLNVQDEDGLMKIKDLSFTVKKGEILTIAGVEGNGQTELAEALLGFRQAVSGEIYACGQNITKMTVRERRKYCAYIPEDRGKTGLNVYASFHDNMIGGLLRKRGMKKGPFLNYKFTKKFVQDLIDKFDIKTASQQIAVKSLSGGNQQKIVVARELEYNDDVLIVSQPSRGVDFGATRFIHKQLIQRRNEGKGILLISTDLDEVFALSDRIVVLFEGKIVAVFRSFEVTPEEIGLYMTGAKEQTEEELKGGAV